MIGRLLGYTQVQTTARYTYLKTDPIRAAANKVSDAIALTLPVKDNSNSQSNLDIAA